MAPRAEADGSDTHSAACLLIHGACANHGHVSGQRALEFRLGQPAVCVRMHGENLYEQLAINPQKTIDGLGYWIHNGLCLAAEDDEQIVGMFFASVQQTWFSDEPFAREDLFYVRPESRGSRAAYMLMREFMAWTKLIGVRFVRAGAATGTGEGAERLYQKFGMQHTGGNYAIHHD